MRILVEPSDYVLHNLGDIACCELRYLVAAYFPNAAIEVLSDDPDASRNLLSIGNASGIHRTPAMARQRLLPDVGPQKTMLDTFEETQRLHTEHVKKAESRIWPTPTGPKGAKRSPSASRHQGARSRLTQSLDVLNLFSCRLRPSGRP
jgi:hypothetical protein